MVSFPLFAKFSGLNFYDSGKAYALDLNLIINRPSPWQSNIEENKETGKIKYYKKFKNGGLWA